MPTKPQTTKTKSGAANAALLGPVNETYKAARGAGRVEVSAASATTLKFGREASAQRATISVGPLTTQTVEEAEALAKVLKAAIARAKQINRARGL